MSILLLSFESVEPTPAWLNGDSLPFGRSLYLFKDTKEVMSVIRPLSEEVVNKIAAGEIIQVRSRVFQDAESRIDD